MLRTTSFLGAALLVFVAGCGKEAPSPPPAPTTPAEDSVAMVLADTATAGERYRGQEGTPPKGSVVYLWLRPDGQAVYAVDAVDGGPLDPQRGTYTVQAGLPGRDTLVLARTLGDTMRFVRTADSLLEARREAPLVDDLLRLARQR